LNHEWTRIHTNKKRKDAESAEIRGEKIKAFLRVSLRPLRLCVCPKFAGRKSVFIRVHSWLKQKPHRRLAVGFDKSGERIRTRPPRGTAARLAAGSDLNYNSRRQTSHHTPWRQTVFRACLSLMITKTLRAPVAWKRKISGGILAVVGFMLSPLSWWNDLVVNVPLALAFAWVVSLFYKPAFEASCIVGYLLTNVLGFVLMHKGAQRASSGEDKKYSRRDLIRDAGISLLYTGLIVVLLKLGVFKPVQDYFAK
jgi:hypothetical protein